MGATTLGAAGAVLSWVDAKNMHQDFLDHGCDKNGNFDCLQRVEDGKSAATRTNILLGGAVVTGIATAAVGIFLVDWRARGDDAAHRAANKPPGSAASAKSPWPRISVALVPGASHMVIRGDF
ncbi:hypothetical protein [Pendulispora albinea]|uniref:Uncharacterized protein n=1 Tax=Pendulispora albinea TaxID=2741071 RepID=A0ABZ2M848_9BACT